MKKLKGVITAMTTPFDKNGVLDIEAAEKQVDFLIEKGVNCLYPTGTTGEMYLMSAKEREILAETIVKRAAGRVTVYIHVGAMTQEDTIRLAKHANKIGADGIGVVTPSYFSVND
jgi:4-hydroxy-tetrahydrodipicolinate synthase